MKTNDSPQCGSCISRREFLEKGAQSLSVLAAAGVAAPLLQACSQQPLSSGGSTLATIPNNATGIYTFNFADYPALANTGGTLGVNVAATSGTKSVYITRVSANAVETVSNVCTHTGCTINTFDSGTQQYLCPCHGSIFGADGHVITGPAATPLPSYASTITATGIQVTIG